ncbi:MAG: SCO family protein [Proteobacteria bacterium]|nr:SCO family protein [Pseudomonadota bacterium]
MNKAILKILTVFLVLLYASPGITLDKELPFENINIEFELLDRAGNLVTETDLRGKFVLLAFGFTRCAHICPMMVANMALTLNVTDKKATGVFISVDTERDTPANAHAYASGFHESMMGLSGSHQQVRAAANNFGISFVVTKSHKAYTVEHTSDIFLIGPDGKLIEVFALNAPPLEIAEAMKTWQ